MNIVTTLKSKVSWKAFALSQLKTGSAVPKEILDCFPDEGALPEHDVRIVSFEGDKVLCADIQDLLIPALQAIFGDDPNKCLYRELVGYTFFFKGIQYRLGYTFDPEEHVYGWYITAL